MAAATRLRRLRVPFPIRLRWAAVRARLTRHVRARRAAVVIVGVLWFLIVSDSAAARRDAVRAWGDTQGVVVAGASADVGAPISAAEPSVEARPSALVTADALGGIPENGARLAWPVRAGEVITARHMAREGPPVPVGLRAIAVPAGQPGLHLVVGSSVEAVLIGDPYGPNPKSRAVPAVVVAVAEGSATIAVTPEDALAVAETLATGWVTLVRR